MDPHTRKSLMSRGALATVALVGALALSLAHLSSSSASVVYPASDGYIADNASVSPFAEQLASIARLDPALRSAVQAAAAEAAVDGVELAVSSGWRSASYQWALLEEATLSHGTLNEARKWVNPPELSAHVTGDAVDIGPMEAQLWLIEHGGDFGLCQIYANERWHFELVTEPGAPCPELKADAAS